MRIASFNLENLDEDRKDKTALKERLAIFKPLIERMNADILCLQEVNAQDATAGTRDLRVLDELLKDSSLEGGYRATSVNPLTAKLAEKHNLAVVSHLPIVDFRQYWHDLIQPVRHRLVTARPETDGYDEIRFDRPLLHAEINLGDGNTLHIVNLHLRAPLAAAIPGQKIGPFAWESTSGWAEGFFLAGVKRSAQALEARLLIDRILDGSPDALILVCGDFNAEIFEVPARIIRGDLEDTGHGRLAVRMMVPLERTIPQSQRFSIIHRGRKLMLDHMLVSRALLARYRHFEVHNEALGDELVASTMVEGSPDAYHAPIVAEFSL